MHERLFISLAGNPNSGKTTAANRLADIYGFNIIRPSDLIRTYASEHNLVLNERQDYIKSYLAMIADYGEDYVVNSVLSTPGQSICVDGERIPHNITQLKAIGAKVIAFWCPIGIRHSRAVLRGEARDKINYIDYARDEALEYDSHEPPFTSVMSVMQMADYHVDASLPQNEVFHSVDKIVNPLISPQAH